MRKQLSVTFVCFFFASAAAFAQSWKPYEKIAKEKTYEKFDCVTLLDSTLVSVQPTGQGSFAVCKVKRPAVICGGLQGDIGMYGAFFNRLTACCFHSSGPVAGGIFYSRDRISSSVEPFAEASFSVRMRFSRFFT